MGAAARLRHFYLDLVAGDEQVLDEEILGKIRLLESALPLLCRLLRMPGVRSLADLFPDDDAEAEQLLQMLHDWAERMLDPAGDVIEQPPPEPPALEAAS